MNTENYFETIWNFKDSRKKSKCSNWFLNFSTIFQNWILSNYCEAIFNLKISHLKVLNFNLVECFKIYNFIIHIESFLFVIFHWSRNLVPRGFIERIDDISRRQIELTRKIKSKYCFLLFCYLPSVSVDRFWGHMTHIEVHERKKDTIKNTWLMNSCSSSPRWRLKYEICCRDAKKSSGQKLRIKINNVCCREFRERKKVIKTFSIV